MYTIVQGDEVYRKYYIIVELIHKMISLTTD